MRVWIVIDFLVTTFVALAAQATALPTLKGDQIQAVTRAIKSADLHGIIDTRGVEAVGIDENVKRAVSVYRISIVCAHRTNLIPSHAYLTSQNVGTSKFHLDQVLEARTGRPNPGSGGGNSHNREDPSVPYNRGCPVAAHCRGGKPPKKRGGDE